MCFCVLSNHFHNILLSICVPTPKGTLFEDNFRSTYGIYVLYIFAHPFPAFACLHESCTGLQLDNIVHRVHHASSFKMMYRNLGTSGGEANSVNSPHI